MIHAVDAERGLLLVRGAIPGPDGGLVMVRSAAKRVAPDAFEPATREQRSPKQMKGPTSERHCRCEGVTRSVNVQSPSGDLKRTAELPAAVFDVQVNVPLIHQVVVGQLAAARQGTADTKTRGEVRGGGKKPYRQKGTGRARQGSTRAPQFAGGGVVHGPTPRSYVQRTPKKMKAAALRGALSDRARHGRVHVVSGVVDEPPRSAVDQDGGGSSAQRRRQSPRARGGRAA